MGVPGFFAYILKHCKNINQIIIKSIDTQIDNFYLDTNGIIHPSCFQVLDKTHYNLSLDKLEELMLNNIIKNIDDIINYVNPKKTVYIAIDGVAPLAKITQQRYRRYKSLYDDNLKNPIKNKYHKLQHNWSNSCITPGTEFMKKVHNEILKYIDNKNGNTNKNKLTYLYSSCYEPGEGEHKIMQYIKNNVPLNDSILVYGLDADLLFLTMNLKHERVFLIREINDAPNNKNNTNKNNANKLNTNKITVDNMNYEYVNINELRTSIIELMLSHSTSIKPSVNLIHDFTFLCYILGNDFLPHMPFIDIYNDGIDILIEKYIELKETNDYLIRFNEKGEVSIDIIFLDELIQSLSLVEKDIYQHKLTETETKTVNSRELYKSRVLKNLDGYDKEIFEIENFIKQRDIYSGIRNYDDHKFRYYEYYFYTVSNQQMLIDNLCKNYLEGLMWITKYYFNSCISWNWTYNYCKCPFITDLSKYIKTNKFNINYINFDIGKPLHPKHQLVCVIPKKYIPLLIPEYTEIINDMSVGYMFPNEYDIDGEDKNALWKCEPVLPMLNIELIVKKFKI